MPVCQLPVVFCYEGAYDARFLLTRNAYYNSVGYTYMARRKRAFITGICGQDGSFLTGLLLEKGYEVHGLVRRSSSLNRERIDHLVGHPEWSKRLILHYGDLTDSSSLTHALERSGPDEVYNLGAQSHVRVSFDIPEYTMDVVGLGTVRLLEALRALRSKARFYQASSSEMYGRVIETPQSEKTPFNPQSPYAIAKLLAHNAARNYREAYGMFVANGILFNHESERRGENFVTRKITIGVAEILAGKRKKLFLGNLDAARDWGYARDYVEAMWLMLQQDEPDDYVIATGETHTVREFLETAFNIAGITNWQRYVASDPRLYRPTEVDILSGDARKARRKLGWKPRVRFKELVRIMLESDMKRLGTRAARSGYEG